MSSALVRQALELVDPERKYRLIQIYNYLINFEVIKNGVVIIVLDSVGKKRGVGRRRPAGQGSCYVTRRCIIHLLISLGTILTIYCSFIAVPYNGSFYRG